MQENEVGKTALTYTFSLKAGISYFILGGLLLLLSLFLLFVVIPFIQNLAFYSFLGLVLARYVWLVALISKILAIVGIMLLLWPLGMYLVNEYQVTEKGVFYKRLNVKGVDRTNIDRAVIKSISIRQGFLGKMLLYGDIIIITTQGTYSLVGLDNPSYVVETMRKKMKI